MTFYDMSALMLVIVIVVISIFPPPGNLESPPGGAPLLEAIGEPEIAPSTPTPTPFQFQSNEPDTFCFDEKGVCDASLYNNMENSVCACTCDEIGTGERNETETFEEKETKPDIEIPCVNTVCDYKETCDQNQNISSKTACPCGFSGPTCQNVVEEIFKPLEKSFGELPKDSMSLNSVLKGAMSFALIDVSMEDTLKYLVYSTEDFIKRCSIRGKKCENIEVQTDPPDLRSCYSINYRLNTSVISTNAGTRQTMDIVLFVNQTEFIQTSEKSGVKLVIHEHDLPVFPHNQGISLPTGFLITMALKKNSLTNLGYPYGKCVNSTSEVPYYWYNGPYTLEGCWNTCQQRASIDICGCGDPRFVLPQGENYKFCGMDQKDCLTRLEQRILYHRYVRTCECFRPCRDVNYEATFTMVTWPAKKHLPSLCRKAIRKNSTNAEACIVWYRDNFVKIKIYFVELNHILFQERPLMTIANFVSKLGGIAAIFLGISFVSFVEFIVFIYDMIRSALGMKLTMQWHKTRMVAVKKTSKTAPATQK